MTGVMSGLSLRSAAVVPYVLVACLGVVIPGPVFAMPRRFPDHCGNLRVSGLP